MPYSGVYPYYAQHITAGFLCAAAKMSHAATDFAFMPAYIGQGSNKAVLEAAQKLIFFEGVDVMMGMINPKMYPELRTILENHNKLGLFFDFGESISSNEVYSPNISNLSMNLWQSEYALGQWATKELGERGQMISPLYESGFNLGSSFLMGVGSAGSNQLKSMVLKENHANKDVLDLKDFFAAINADAPDYVHAIFVGRIGNEFLRQWKASKFNNVIPLVTVENMAYPDMLEDIGHLGLNFYSASSWSKEHKTGANPAFVRDFENFGKQQANIFGMLGYEAGLILSRMKAQLTVGNASTAVIDFNQSGTIGPRGLLHFGMQEQQSFPLIDIVKINTSNKKNNATIISQGTALGYDISTVYSETESGWQNPYLSV
ncbi:amino acid/amide ABC transporter substrate-binding protein, HAAT family [Pedobacter soli]|uniref:Amino acid/amide ABC transporter substrate-binding protein, HAAT family n=2 Tax=Pedobacter soli TaxID=390242 RepID=A0A1G6JSS4_9SPHI|nr:amino acid/amide ABC transporter substrate-binding protein, HAAT family [Pedobacter soli]